MDIAVNSVRADYIFTFGDYEQKVLKEVQRHSRKHGAKKVKIVHMGNESEHHNASGPELFKQIVAAVEEKECLLLGAVNIHTSQSQAILKLLEKKYAH